MATTATPKETSAKARKPPERSVNAPATTPLVLAAFAAVYLLWGSTYLAIRVGVETVPPLILAGLRHFTVGVFLDRKSTRLNSSHSQISYAVFCLKKKNRIHERLMLCFNQYAPVCRLF